MALALLLLAAGGFSLAIMIGTERGSRRGCGRGCAACGNREICHRRLRIQDKEK